MEISNFQKELELSSNCSPSLIFFKGRGGGRVKMNRKDMVMMIKKAIKKNSCTFFVNTSYQELIAESF
jgi:hypothetical protein